MKQSRTVCALFAAVALLGIPLSVQAQATIQENALGFCGVQGTVDSNHSGFTGTGFANANNAIGSGVDWSVNAAASGVYQLEWRFANGSTSRPGSVKINGTTVTTVSFPSTGVWNSWTTVSTTVNLNAGWNSIRLEATTSAGLANIDSLAVTGGSGVQAAPCDGGTAEILIEENTTGFCSVNGTIDSNHAGFTGSGFANGNNATGAGVEWNVRVPSSGNYLLEWRHANGSTTNRPGSVRVNGASVATVNFPATGAWTTWTVVSSANIALSAGDNTIRLEATTSAGLSNIDSLSVIGNSPQPVDCASNPDNTPNVSHRGTSTLTTIGHRVVTYTGYMNGESFQQEGIRTFNGWQYAVFWDSSSYVNISRRQLPSGAWQNIRFTDYRTSSTDSHNVISMGISHLDGTIHLAFDMHNSPMRYRISKPGAALNPAGTAWTASLFSATSSTLKGQWLPSSLTYPAFISSPGGKLQMTIRDGASGGGDQLLYEYNGAGSSGAWTSIGKIIEGGTANAYMFGQEYSPSGCLHMSWNWRQTSNPSTNHDLLYAYSCDEGRTWRNNADATIATTGSNPLSASSSGIRVWAIGQNRGLINQESMVIDANGFVHVIASHMPDWQPNDSDFTRARAKSVVMHYFRNPSSRGWTRRVTPFVEHSARSDVVADSNGNLYVVSGDDTTKRLHIETASAASGWSDWTLKWTSSSIYFSDPLLDHWRTKTENTISIFQPRWNSGTIDVLDWNVIP